MRDFALAIERSGASVIYAGKIAVNGLHSSQIPQAEWDAFVLAQYPSREGYAASAASTEVQKVHKRLN